MELISAVNQILSTLTVVGQIISVVIILSFVAKRGRIIGFFAKHALVFSFVVALLAVLGSLFYSEIAGYEPCKLCWFQRIFMYPQAVMLGLAFYRREKSILNYNIALSFFGAAAAAYHYLLQVGAVRSLSCGVVGYSVSCVERFVTQFGYITIPMMSFTAFLLIIVFATASKIRRT